MEELSALPERNSSNSNHPADHLGWIAPRRLSTKDGLEVLDAMLRGGVETSLQDWERVALLAEKLLRGKFQEARKDEGYRFGLFVRLVRVVQTVLRSTCAPALVEQLVGVLETNPKVVSMATWQYFLVLECLLGAQVTLILVLALSALMVAPTAATEDIHSLTSRGLEYLSLEEPPQVPRLAMVLVALECAATLVLSSEEIRVGFWSPRRPGRRPPLSPGARGELETGARESHRGGTTAALQAPPSPQDTLQRRPRAGGDAGDLMGDSARDV